jgi:ribonuclease VapC
LILDSSAIVAVLRREPSHRVLGERIRDADSVGVGAPTLVEAELVIAGRLGPRGRGLLRSFVHEESVDVIPFDDRHWREAGSAFHRFGKGRHRAALNYGDCMTYATARLAGEPLLCVGDDFALTDLALA